MKVCISGHSDDIMQVGNEEYGAWSGCYVEFLNGDVVFGNYEGCWVFAQVVGDAGKLNGSFYEATDCTVFMAWSSWPVDESEESEQVDAALCNLDFGSKVALLKFGSKVALLKASKATV